MLLRHDFEQMFGQIFSIRVKTLSNKNLLASRHIITEKGPLPVDARLPQRRRCLKSLLHNLFKTRDPENHTLLGGTTYPVRPSKGLPQPPLPPWQGNSYYSGTSR